MNDIVVTYPFWGFKREVKAKVPTSWGELNAEQFVAVVRTINGATADIGFVATITGIGKRLLRRMHPYSLAKLSETIGFLGNVASGHGDFIIKAPHVPLGRDMYNVLVAPRPKLANMEFGQFIFADSYYNAWAATKSHTALNMFVASIYLPEGEKFNADTIDKRSTAVAGIDLLTREAIAFNWGLVTIWLQKAYPLVFQQPTAEEEKGAAKSRTTQSPWLKLFDQLVGDNLPERDRWAALPVNAVFRHLTEKFKEQARQK
jgi:hypothetical protein